MISEETVAATIKAIKESADSDCMGMWRHPLYVGFPLPDNLGTLEGFEAFSLERIVRHKLTMRETALSKRDFDRYVFIGTERPFRLEALLFLIDASYLDYDSAEYNTLLRDVWIDCEHPQINDAHWRHLFSLAKPEKLLSEEDQRAWRHLYGKAKLASGQLLDIYRGTTLDEFRLGRKALGLSWTTNYSTAAWFANRWASRERRPVVLKQRVDIGALLGPFTQRGEHEVILLDPVAGEDFTAFHPKGKQATLETNHE